MDPRFDAREKPSQDPSVAAAEKRARAISTIGFSMGEMAQRITAGWLPNVYGISSANCSAQNSLAAVGPRQLGEGCEEMEQIGCGDAMLL